MDNPVFASAQELAAAIRTRQLSAVEVLEAHLAQIDKHNPQLNVIVTRDDERARTRAQEADTALARGQVWGPLHGVPITVKDAFATAGMRTTSGNPSWADFVPQTDAPVVARLRAAGAVLLGKTNLPTLSVGGQTNNPLFGRTNNPWDLSRTCGGSTGGAAAVAAGLSPLELGSDIVGSVRWPAHCCGIYCLKPSIDRFPGGGYHPNPQPESPESAGLGMGVFGPLARSIDDLALAFQVMAGPDSNSWKTPPVPVGEMPDLRQRRLRLAWTDNCGDIAVNNDTRLAMERLAGDLAQAGHHVQRCLPDSFDFVEVCETCGVMLVAQFGGTEEVAAMFWADPKSANPILRGTARAVGMALPEYMTCLHQVGQFITALETFLASWDAFICPVSPTPAFPHCTPDTPILVDGRPVEIAAGLVYLAPFNLTGHPVVVLPVAHSHEGLPIGVQVVGRRWAEMPLLAVAKRITEVTGSFQRPPGY